MSANPPGVTQKRSYDRTSYILVVDDDNTLLKFFKIHLNKFFSKVIVVKNAKEAIEALRENVIDLVISDIRMPRMDGLQLMARVRKHDPGIPVLLVSGALLTPEQEHACDNEADGFLRKPFQVDDLHAFISHGMDLREAYVKITQLLPDKKHLRAALAGDFPSKKIKDAEARKQLEALLASLETFKAAS